MVLAVMVERTSFASASVPHNLASPLTVSTGTLWLVGKTKLRNSKFSTPATDDPVKFHTFRVLPVKVSLPPPPPKS